MKKISCLLFMMVWIVSVTGQSLQSMIPSIPTSPQAEAFKMYGDYAVNPSTGVIKTAEKKLGQAERKAASDLTSSGRTAAIRNAETNLAAARATKQIAGGFTGNGCQLASNTLILSPFKLSPSPESKAKSDATTVKLKYNIKL